MADKFERFVGPVSVLFETREMQVNPSYYPHLTISLVGLGLFFMAWFFVYEVSVGLPAGGDVWRPLTVPRVQVTSTKYTRNLLKELLVSSLAAVFLGFGSVFLLLWVGIYV